MKPVLVKSASGPIGLHCKHQELQLEQKKLEVTAGVDFTQGTQIILQMHFFIWADTDCVFFFLQSMI